MCFILIFINFLDVDNENCPIVTRLEAVRLLLFSEFKRNLVKMSPTVALIRRFPIGKILEIAEPFVTANST